MSSSEGNAGALSSTPNPWAEDTEDSAAKDASVSESEWRRDARQDSDPGWDKVAQTGSNAVASANTGTSSSVPQLTTQFDEFDPFRPSHDAVPDVEHAQNKQDVQNEPTASETASQGTSNASPPATPAKANRQAEKKPASESSVPHADDQGQSKSTQPAVPAKGKTPQQASQQSAPMTPTGSSSGLSNPLATIASAFRKRDFSSNNSPSGSGSPTQPAAPIGKPAPAILVRDQDDMAADIEDSEKEAPPAVPSVSGSHGHDGNEESDGAPAFDFNYFLEQMRSRQAEPIAKYLRSFLREFTKKQWSVNDQIRVINDFLDFIAIKMRENEVWKNDPEADFENAVEGMEKLVMNRVFPLAFIPALDPARQATTQTDDLERDHVFSQRIRLFQWVNEEHLDLPKHKDTPSFVEFAKSELRKINNYKAPRDKLICILNSCKVIFGLMRHLELEDGADTFIPFLILVVLRANPEHLISNVQYIQRFRNPDRLAGENGYYLSSLNAAISFIETMDSSSLSNIDQAEFEQQVERAIRSLPGQEEHHLPEPAPKQHERPPPQPLSTPSGQAGSSHSLPGSPTKPSRSTSEKRLSHQSRMESEQGPPRSQSPAEATREFFVRSSDNLQKNLSKPLQTLGRIFTEMGSESEVIAGYPAHTHQQQQHALQAPMSPQQPAPRGQRPPPHRTRSQASMTSPISPALRQTQRLPPQGAYSPGYISGVAQQPIRPSAESRTSSYQPADFVDDSVSAEEVQAAADKQYQANFNAKIETLTNIFPGIERETLEIVLLSNGEDVERTIEGLLDMQ